MSSTKSKRRRRCRKIRIQITEIDINMQFRRFPNRSPRDQFVCSIRNGNTHRKLLSKDRSFEQALQIASADEAADAEAKQLHYNANSVAIGSIVGAVAVKTKGYASKSSAYKCSENTTMQPTRQCYRCNGSHAHHNFKCKDAICHFCKKSGHIAEACRMKQSTLSEMHVVCTAPL